MDRRVDVKLLDDDIFDIELKLLLEGILLRYQHDFRDYSVASLRRRMRQAMERFGCASLSQLQDRILHEPAMFAQMLQFFTVQVSEMFRDPAYFRALREKMRRSASILAGPAASATGRGRRTESMEGWMVNC